MIVAKFLCQSITNTENGEDVTLSAVTHQAGTPEDPNLSWSEATPCGRIEMTISNPLAKGKFEAGKCYLVNFDPSED